MKEIFSTIVCVLLINFCTAQYTLRIVVNEVATKKPDDIYLTGSFNNWNPKDDKYKLKPFGVSRRAIILKDMAAGEYEFKFTRGSWDKVETTAKGEGVSNHKVSLKDDVGIDFNIPGWKDDFPDKPKPNTATAQVSIVDTAFFMPQLNRKRRIWAYLPKGYATSKKTYPVIYLQDGQNLFNEKTAPSKEWGVDEFLDSAIKKFNKECIVIGIDNGGEKRMTEYNPFDTPESGKGEGKQCAEFLALTLKPFIDKKFRTQKEAKQTFVGGSSMGALISLYIVIKYPNIFGGAGIFSPAFWLAPQIFYEVEKADWLNYLPKFFFYAGGKESETMVPDMDKVIAIIEKKGRYSLRRFRNPLAKHNEEAWRKAFPEFYNFVMQ
jgi:predicted alpha/beta superfamily hydrolase